ncbi:MAG: histidine kinase [Bacteroidota bacterium]
MPTRRTAIWGLRVAILFVSALSMLPIARVVADAVEFARVIGRTQEAPPPRGFDGIEWTDEGAIVAAYVMPRGPGDAAGIRAGDELAALDFAQVFTADDLVAQTQRATGTVQAYSINRDGQRLDVDVAIVRYPTFLYPLSQTLWAASGWGFALATVLHLLALSTVLPFVRRSPRAMRSAVLIGAALLWVGGNLLRILWVALVGPPSGLGGAEGVFFDTLTLMSLAGWTLFPFLLLREVLITDRRTERVTRSIRWVLAIPPLVLGIGVSVATVAGHVGPVPPDAFVPPILFYICVYVAAASALSLAPRGWDPDTGATVWGRIGSALVLAVAVLGALYVYNVLPTFTSDVGVTAGWLVTALQLISVLPVSLVSFSTLRFGQFETVLVRSLVYVAALSGVFLAVAGGAALLDAATAQPGGAGPLAIAAWVVGILVLADRLAPPFRRWARQAFRAQRVQALRQLDRFGDRIRFILDPDELATEAVETVGRAFEAQSAVVFLRSHTDNPNPNWRQASYRPSPPYFTREDLDRIWEKVRTDGRVWARNAELNEAMLDTDDTQRLESIGAALAVPVANASGVPVGLIVLGEKSRRLAVYTTEDVERLQSLGGQIALAGERLRLVERERALVRQTAEAELAALRAQINPHFLFNALNTVASLIDEHPEEAETTVENLAGLFRDVLTASGATFVSLSDELRLVRRYLTVEQARFGEKLLVEIDIAPDTDDLPIPAFAVQTLVENAVKHGIERKRGGGQIRIASWRQNGEVVVDVQDTGVGIPELYASPPESSASPSSFFGVGLTNVAQRLDQLYDGSDRLTLQSTPEGTQARLRIPARPNA